MTVCFDSCVVICDKQFKSNDDFVWAVENFFSGRFIVDVEFLDLKIASPSVNHSNLFSFCILHIWVLSIWMTCRYQVFTDPWTSSFKYLRQWTNFVSEAHDCCMYIKKNTEIQRTWDSNPEWQILIYAFLSFSILASKVEDLPWIPFFLHKLIIGFMSGNFSFFLSDKT